MSDPLNAQARSLPRGRHAPPLEVRRAVQRQRLFEAAASVFARSGYAEASAEAISREAGMSKATFYEHFANKEECILALFDHVAEEVLAALLDAAAAAGEDPAERMRAGLRSFLEFVVVQHDAAQTLIVQIIGAGPRASERRDAVLARFSDAIYEQNVAAAAAGGFPRFASPHDAFAVVGAIAELVSRHLRLGVPGDIRELEPVIERLLLGMLEQADAAAA